MVCFPLEIIFLEIFTCGILDIFALLIDKAGMLEICICHVSIYKHLYCRFQVNEGSLGVYINSNCGTRLINMPTVRVNSMGYCTFMCCIYVILYFYEREA